MRAQRVTDAQLVKLLQFAEACAATPSHLRLAGRVSRKSARVLRAALRELYDRRRAERQAAGAATRPAPGVPVDGR